MAPATAHRCNAFQGLRIDHQIMNHPAIDIEKTAQALEASRLFDAEHYLTKYEDVRAASMDPCFHYVVAGELEGRMPNALFEPRWYQSVYGIDPRTHNLLLHYVEHGERQGMVPSPLFDPVYVRSTYGLDPSVSALGYFMSAGKSAPVNPNAIFDVQEYLSMYPDIALSGQAPYLHFIEYGVHESRMPRKDFNWTHVRCAFPADRNNLEIYLTACAFAQMTHCRL